MSSSQRTQQQYDQYAESYDALDSGAAANALGFPQLRKELLAQASGHVLELAVGTGLNLPLYTADTVTALSAVDISGAMLQQAQRRVRGLQQSFTVDLKQGDVAALPYPDNTFDTVVDTFSLCVFPQPLAALQEAARVVKPGGRVLVLEHQRSSFAPLAWYQDVTAAAVAATGKGCYWNQDVKDQKKKAAAAADVLHQFVMGKANKLGEARSGRRCQHISS
ncbi:hypothetical protein CVIRNUC_010364 [Coccomyxa viridis]|uniref:Methyltransferase type 11 domain-containing protein n=1 Tax=Coccomyxa viridis TaxID=1274662 RepID=A0AAV1IIP6_9CHLO|nr:hypothetical protein CVIRNUC_010364 [Coccomyxa viridis]